jgi:hypothetical protein
MKIWIVTIEIAYIAESGELETHNRVPAAFTSKQKAMAFINSHLINEIEDESCKTGRRTKFHFIPAQNNYNLNDNNKSFEENRIQSLYFELNHSKVA